MLSQEEIKALYAKLNSLGEDQVRSNIANGIYGKWKINHINEWLRQQEQNDSSNINNTIIETLGYIKNNRNCNSQSLNIDVVTDLYNSGYIEGVDVSSDDGNEFIELRININGEHYLQELIQEEVRDSSQRIQNEDRWYQKPIGQIGIGITIVVLGTFALRAIGI